MSKHTNYSVKEVRESARSIVILMNIAPGNSLYKPIFNKYSTIKFLRVAKIPVMIKEESMKMQTEWIHINFRKDAFLFEIGLNAPLWI